MDTSTNLHLGLVTYYLVSGWDLPTIIQNCQATQVEGVELRTTHQHGVETHLLKNRRVEIKKQIDDSGVRLISLGSAFQYHAANPAEVQKNIYGTMEYVMLGCGSGLGRH
ncbi:hypothetical protein KAH55_13560 [bacterium]|nr:hypothetical protein [bacterium]